MTNRTDRYDRYVPMLVELASLVPDDPRRGRLQEELVRAFRPVARNIATRFARRGEPTEDLEQVALIGLINALERYDPARNADFLSYAVPTMMGEVRRHFRDATWTIRTPRGLKDLSVSLSRATASLSHRLGRAPTTSELADHLDVDADLVREALALSSCQRPASLERTIDGAGDGELLDLLGATDEGFDRADATATIAAAVGDLPERERRLLALRFVHDQTQREIASALGISQMHVSRLLTQTLDLLRTRLMPAAESATVGPTDATAA